jgi:hypothetical protein|nr:MAG TPA: hypothetical protein [Caudoviricetes sp.]
MTQSDIYVKIRELENKINETNNHIIVHSLIKKENNYWYLLGQLDVYKFLIE